MYDLTLEQMVANAEDWQAELKEADTILKSAARSSREWRLALRRKINAKMALEEYLGWTEHIGKFIEEGIAPDGNRIGHWAREAFHKGVIQREVEKPDNMLKESNLGERFKGRTFASFDAKRDKEAFDSCSAYARDEHLMERQKNGLLLVGGYGNGKTHLAAAVTHALIDRGLPVLFGTYIAHLDNIRREFDNTQKESYLAKMKVTPVLVIDDLGKEKKTEWTRQTLFDVINFRYEHMLPTIITTNLCEQSDRGISLNALASHVEEAVWSRLCEMCNIVETKGSDYRRI